MCRKLVLEDEDIPQDEAEGLRLVREDQKRQYDKYVALLDPDVAQQSLTELRNNVKSRAEYFREYRKRPKKCPHCKKQI
jgi:hypothetical protein